MTDKWPRYEVFKQDRPEQPHRNVGSVYAPDAELALLNARDVFARRPACHSLWVVPAAVITTWNSAGPLPALPSGPPQRYVVCAKQSQRQAMTYVDYVTVIEADGPTEALRAATSRGDAAAAIWWVFPEGAVSRSDDGDAADYAAATAKRFRLPNQYHTVFTMQKIRRGEEGSE
jgi:ring-1,2-phenylacetyl-CoA epoxidase subunit PaaB